MVLINQRVADEIGTLVARHRYAVEDARDSVKAAEAASAKANAELKAAAAERQAELVKATEKARTEKEKEQAEEKKEPAKPRGQWAARQDFASNEINFGSDDDEEFDSAPRHRAAPQPPSPQTPYPQPPAAAPGPPPAPSRGREPVFDDDEDDFENQSWLQ